MFNHVTIIIVHIIVFLFTTNTYYFVLYATSHFLLSVNYTFYNDAAALILLYVMT